VWDQRVVITSPMYDLRVQVLDDQGRPVPDAQVIGRDLEGFDFVLATTDRDGRATVRVPAGEAEVTTIYGDLYHVDRLKVQTQYLDCVEKCFLSGTDELRKTPHELTVRLK